MNIPFSPPFIGEEEIKAVSETLRSGWITTGPKTKEFERRLSEFCGTEKTVCLNSATAALEMILRAFGIGPGDEVITTAYTYTASASVTTHIGATLKLVDCKKDSYLIDVQEIEKAITEKTKAIIPVDIGGMVADYQSILKIAEDKKSLFTPKNELQKVFGRILVIADAAHSLGSEYCGKNAAGFPDFATFSFHAVKNLTTGEGGAVTWKHHDGLDSEALYKKLQLLSLHGQSKDALSKMQKGAWEYDVVAPYYKCNMTDIMASIGICQLDKYEFIIEKHRKMAARYDEAVKELGLRANEHTTQLYRSNCHLYMLNIGKNDPELRNRYINLMAERDISCNVHFKPLPLLTAYKNLGFCIEDYPNAYHQFINEISLPIYTGMTDDEQTYVMDALKSVTEELCF